MEQHAPVGVGILGCGRMGERHAAALAAGTTFRVTAVADRDASAARALAARAGVPAYDGVGPLCTDPDVALVVVATPTATHAAAVAAALAAGRHVVCEKPLAPTGREVEALCAEAARRGRLLAVDYPYRHAPAFRRLRALLAEGVLGAPHLAVFRIGGRGSHRLWKHSAAEGGGAVFEMMSHMVDLAVWLFGTPQRAGLLARATLLPERRIGDVTTRVDAEDYAVAELDYGRLRCLLQADLVSPSFAQQVEVQAADAAFVGSLVDGLPARLYLGTCRGGHPAGWSMLDLPKAEPLSAHWSVLAIELRDGTHDHWREESRAVAAVLDQLRGST